MGKAVTEEDKLRNSRFYHVLNSFCKSKIVDKSLGQRSQISLQPCAVCVVASTSAWEQALGRFAPVSAGQ